MIVAAGWIAILFVGFCATAIGAASDPGGTVFRLGAFDRSSREFADGEPSRPVNFLIGESNPATDWYSRQSVQLEAESAGSKKQSAPNAPRAITFLLKKKPAALYRLRIALLLESRSVPALVVTINGRHGTFFLHPELDYNDNEDVFDPEYSHADIMFSFAANYLHQGSNTITFQAIAEAAHLDPHASLNYDAIELDSQATGTREESPSAQIVPTIFYERKQGELVELVDVFVRDGKLARSGGIVDLSLSGTGYHQTVEPGGDFGEKRLEFAVPQFPAGTTAQLAWRVKASRNHAQQLIDPGKKWTLFLTPHIHLDVGFTDFQAKVASVQSRVIDEAMDLAAQHPDFRFSLDGEWSLEQFLTGRSPTDQQRLIAAIHKHQLFVPAQYANLLTGFPTAEVLIRSLYPSANFSRTHDTPFNYANITDVPSYSWSYASLLASAGIKYFIASSDNYRAPVLVQGRLNESSPFWWQGPDGKKVLFWYSRIYPQMEHLFGLPPLVAAGHDTLPVFLQAYEHANYHANAVILFGSQAENSDLFPAQAELAEQWNSAYAFPRLEYSGFYDALETISRQMGGDIPTIRGDGGPYWEDGIASDAFYAAMERENESRGPSAEKLATLSSLIDPRIAVDKQRLDRMWADMLLMDEHTFGAWNSVSDPTSINAVDQLQVKNSFAIRAHALDEDITRNSLATLTDSIPISSGGLVIFNTLNWKRSGAVSFDLTKNNEIVDASTGTVVPVEVLRSGEAFDHVRFVAQDVPAFGYKVFHLRNTTKPSTAVDSSKDITFESPYYRVILDPATGSVRSIYDKQMGRELVNQQSPYHFGQYLYVTGGDGDDDHPNSLLIHGPVLPKPDLQIHAAHEGNFVSLMRTPDGWVARMKCSDINTPNISSEIRLFDNEKKIEFVENVEKKEVYSKEAVYFAFPFAMEHPEFQYEIQNGVVDPAKDMYPGAGHEWFSVQHWVSVQQGGVSATLMPLDASLVTLGNINRGAWPSQFGDRAGTIFSYVMNNYWPTNYRAGQGGQFRFRYIITSAASTNAADLSRMGWQEMTPLEINEVLSFDKAVDLPRRLDAKQTSFLQLQDPNLLLETWKPAEDGTGTIFRFLDLGGNDRTVTVRTPWMHITQALQTDAVERSVKPLPLLGTNGFEFPIRAHELVTVKIVP